MVKKVVENVEVVDLIELLWILFFKKINIYLFIVASCI